MMVKMSVLGSRTLRSATSTPNRHSLSRPLRTWTPFLSSPLLVRTDLLTPVSPLHSYLAASSSSSSPSSPKCLSIVDKSNHPSTPPRHRHGIPNRFQPFADLLRRSLYFPLGLAAVYITFFLALLTPFFQRHFIFLHSISFPFFPTYHQPERYGLAPHKTRPFHLATSDGERIGVWHVLPEIFYQTHLHNNNDGEWTEDVYAKALREYPTVLYLHGNSMNRAAPWRIAAYSALTSRIDANVVAIDYRGFGDSTGTPSEEGLVEDAYTAYQWILSQSSPSSPSSHAQPAGITIFGQV